MDSVNSITRREFALGAAAFAAAGCVLSAPEASAEAGADGIRVLFQTHSHGDHYNPAAAVKSGVRRVYVQESWASAAREEIAAAAKRLSLPPRDAARMLGIDPHITKGNYERFANSGTFVAEPKPLTAIIMEATNGDSDADFRMFVHSSVQAVARTVEVLRQNGRYAPPPGQCAYITHLGLKYRDWPSEKIDAELPSGIRSAHDGFETTFC